MNSTSGEGFRPGAMLHLAPALLSAFLVFYLGSSRHQEMPLPQVDFRDKLGHLIAFAFVQFTHFRAARFLMPGGSRFLAIVCSVATATLVGAALEVVQMTLPHRSAEFLDLVADFVGAALMGTLLYWSARPEVS